jgi:hypothetical protein
VGFGLVFYGRLASFGAFPGVSDRLLYARTSMISSFRSDLKGTTHSGVSSKEPKGVGLHAKRRNHLVRYRS